MNLHRQVADGEITIFLLLKWQFVGVSCPLVHMLMSV